MMPQKIKTLKKATPHGAARTYMYLAHILQYPPPPLFPLATQFLG